MTPTCPSPPARGEQEHNADVPEPRSNIVRSTLRLPRRLSRPPITYWLGPSPGKVETLQSPCNLPATGRLDQLQAADRPPSQEPRSGHRTIPGTASECNLPSL